MGARTSNRAEVDPGSIRTDCGEIIGAPPVVIDTSVPAAGSVLKRRTIHSVVLPAITTVGLHSNMKEIGVTWSAVFSEEWFRVAFMVAVPLEFPATAENTVLVDPAGTTTVPGTLTSAWSEETFTVVCDSAGCVSRTVHLVVAPGLSVAVEQLSHDKSAGARNPSVRLIELPFRRAVRTALVSLCISRAVAVKAALVEPALTATAAGTLTSFVLLDRAMLVPPEGAGAETLTEQLVVPGAVISIGLQVRPVGRTIARTVIAVARLTPAAVAVILTGVELETVPASAVKLALSDPTETVTESGTVTTDASEDKPTVNAVVAVLLSNTLQFDLPLEARAVGQQESADTAGATSRPKEKDRNPPFTLAVRVALESLETPAAVAVKPAVLVPGLTVTEGGTPAAVLLLDRTTLAPPAGAAAVNVTVQTLVPGVRMEAGVQVTLAG
jgi:hypothetical protein